MHTVCISLHLLSLTLLLYYFLQHCSGIIHKIWHECMIEAMYANLLSGP